MYFRMEEYMRMVYGCAVYARVYVQRPAQNIWCLALSLHHYPHSLRQCLNEPGASLPRLAGRWAPPVLLPPLPRMLEFYECAARSDQVEAQLLLRKQQAFFPVNRLPKTISMLLIYKCVLGSNDQTAIQI